MKKLLLTVLAIAAIPLTAQLGPRFERVLLPISSQDTPGAFGSLWSIDIWFRNDSDQPTFIEPMSVADAFLPPHSDMDAPIFRMRVGFPPGQFVYVDRALSDKLQFNLRIRDLSRQDETWGTELPVVRENGFHTDRINLLNVPTDARFRQMLRIYEAFPSGSDRVRLRIFPLGSETPAVEEELVLLAGPSGPYSPGYAQVDLTARHPQLKAAELLRVELAPVTANISYWAFITVTNNETQHVTTITPQ